MQPFIQLNEVSFEYKIHGMETLLAVNEVSMSVQKGAHVAVLGRNGSGKSTLARLICGLEMPSTGTITVDGLKLEDDKSAWEIRKKCGVVFQNPDNQIIGTTVEEDVAFGPENLGMPREKMIIEIDKALNAVGLSDRKKTAPHLLSGGQKQKLAIAGILAMSPQCFILDEATSMLDPSTRVEFMKLITELVRQRNLTVINITHNMEEAIIADYVYIMADGKVVMEGTPREVFEEDLLIREKGLDVPVHMEITKILSRMTKTQAEKFSSFDLESAKNEILNICEHAFNKYSNEEKLLLVNESLKKSSEADFKESILEVNDLNYTYSPETVFAREALKDVSFEIRKGELFGIAGHTGSGKSTLVQHFNGLIRPQSGKVRVMEYDTSGKDNIRKIRKVAGLLFQYPEHQLFEETVYKDIAFGPKSLGMNEAQINSAVESAIKIVGLDESFLFKSPFELSGGQKRRVAIAGIIAMEPKILILDEPAAGLDPAGREEILSFVKALCDSGTTVVLVSHNMDDLARLADRILVLKEGNVEGCLTPEDLFSDKKRLEEFGLSLPLITQFLELLKQEIPDISLGIFESEKCARNILSEYFRKRRNAL